MGAPLCQPAKSSPGQSYRTLNQIGSIQFVSKVDSQDQARGETIQTVMLMHCSTAPLTLITEV